MSDEAMGLPGARDKPLFTPGPLTTSLPVKMAMLRDLGSRDTEFIDTVSRVRETLLQIAGVSREEGFEAVLMQGSGTFGIEAVIGGSVPPHGKLLVAVNGAYGERMVQIAERLGIETVVVRGPETEPIDPKAIDKELANDHAVTNVAVVHCETTTGLINPVEQVGQVARRHGNRFILDSMSAFGAVPIHLEACAVDYLVSSSNKCIEGVPGFSFTICRRSALNSSAGWARSLSLDLHAQWKGLEKNGQFRFTPPTHAILAFDQALRELQQEGGVEGRSARYQRNREVLRDGMRAMGFAELLEERHQGWIITSFHSPTHANYAFEDFYNRLSDRGLVIYPGKVSNADCFRIGHIGRLFEADTRALLGAIRDVLTEMEVPVPLEREAAGTP